MPALVGVRLAFNVRCFSRPAHLPPADGFSSGGAYNISVCGPEVRAIDQRGWGWAPLLPSTPSNRVVPVCSFFACATQARRCCMQPGNGLHVKVVLAPTLETCIGPPFLFVARLLLAGRLAAFVGRVGALAGQRASSPRCQRPLSVLPRSLTTGPVVADPPPPSFSPNHHPPPLPALAVACVRAHPDVAPSQK